MKAVASFLADHGLVAVRFSNAARGKTKTPDCVSKNGTFAFYCEVKSIAADDVLGLRKDPVFNRLTDDIHTAIKQFDAVNQESLYPNVLAFVNHDSACGFLDLLAVMTGNFFTEGGQRHPIYTQFSEGRTKDEKKRIDMFIWLDDFKPFRLLFGQAHNGHHLALCGWFQIDATSIQQVGT